MKRSEITSRVLIMAGVILAVAVPLFYTARTPIIHARMADTGGWSPDVIQAEVGKILHLKFSSDDVVHGFAVGQMDMDSVTIEPGKVTDVTLTFDKPGTYTFFCTRWCGVNHWRMRGTIEVSGPDPITTPASEIPLYVTLGIDIDAPHESAVIPFVQPSAGRGEKLAADVHISELTEPGIYRSSSPYQIFTALAEAPLSDAERWDVVAYIWRSNTTPESLADGRELYTQNCAACHGESGGGDGVFADEVAAAGVASMQTMNGDTDMAMQKPAAFTDAQRMLGASPALLEAKILRGGMGTGMPMWGSFFTGGQIRDLVAFLYSFQFEYQQ